MKTLIIAVTLAVSATTGVAYAAGATATGVENAAATHLDQTAPGASAQPRTRAQVRAELVQAEKSGQLANLNRMFYQGGN